MAIVLVVDDHPVNRNLVVTLMGYRGHTMLEAPDGAEALRIARVRHPDLIITDLLMPEMDGYELVRELRADPSLTATRVIFYTADYLRDEVQLIAETLGVRYFVPKPADPQLLLETADEALADDALAAVVAPSKETDLQYARTVSGKLSDKLNELAVAQIALKDSEARYRSLAECSPVGVFSLDQAGNVSYSNPRLGEICGLPAGASGQAWTDLLHADDKERVIAELMTAIRAGAPYRGRVRITPLTAGGSGGSPPRASAAGGSGGSPPRASTAAMRWANIQAIPVRSDGGRRSYVGTVEDVTAAVMAREQDEALEARLQAERVQSRLVAILEAAPDALVGVDPRGSIVLVNSQTEAMFGYRRDELAGQPVEILVPDAIKARHEAIRGRYEASPRHRPMASEMGLRARRRDGSVFPVQISLSAIDQGDQMLILAAIRDVTEWRELLAERDRLKARLQRTASGDQD